MKRFDCKLGSNGFDSFFAEMEETDITGDWVRYEDALAMKSALELIRSKFPGSTFGYEQYAKEVHRIANETLNVVGQ